MDKKVLNKKATPPQKMASLKWKKPEDFLVDELQISNLVRFMSHLMLSPLFVSYKGHVIRSSVRESLWMIVWVWIKPLIVSIC